MIRRPLPNLTSARSLIKYIIHIVHMYISANYWENKFFYISGKKNSETPEFPFFFLYINLWTDFYKNFSEC